MEEVWKDIEGYENYYQVSNLGKVRSLDRVIKGAHYKGKILVPQPARSGYLHIGLTTNRKTKMFYIHRLVARAFVEGYFDNALVNHKDENRKNNKASNLEWCTKSYNLNYGSAYENRMASRRVKVDQFTKDGKFIQTIRSIADAGRLVNIPVTDIWAVCKGIKKSAAGYIWKYSDI